MKVKLLLKEIDTAKTDVESKKSRLQDDELKDLKPKLEKDLKDSEEFLKQLTERRDQSKSYKILGEIKNVEEKQEFEKYIVALVNPEKEDKKQPALVENLLNQIKSKYL